LLHRFVSFRVDVAASWVDIVVSDGTVVWQSEGKWLSACMNYSEQRMRERTRTNNKSQIVKEGRSPTERKEEKEETKLHTHKHKLSWRERMSESATLVVCEGMTILRDVADAKGANKENTGAACGLPAHGHASSMLGAEKKNWHRNNIIMDGVVCCV
jgi:hypothetical protein